MSAENVSISCIIPTLGRGGILVETVRQLIEQTKPPSEIIIVDQTPIADPGTEAALKNLETHTHLKVIRQAEPNASLARNAGALAATGEILVFLDDDIRVEPGFLQAYQAAFDESNITAAAGQVLEGDGETVDELPKRALAPRTGWLHFPRNYSKPCSTLWMASGNFAIRRNVFLEVGGMDANYERGAFREESDFAMRYIRQGYTFKYVPDASIYHLGASGSPQGGSRNWTRNKRIAGWHHCVGDWYFTFGNASVFNVFALLRCSVRHFVLNRYNVTHPWWLILLFFRWLAAAPPALLRRWQGPRLIVQSAPA